MNSSFLNSFRTVTQQGHIQGHVLSGGGEWTRSAVYSGTRVAQPGRFVQLKSSADGAIPTALDVTTPTLVKPAGGGVATSFVNAIVVDDFSMPLTNTLTGAVVPAPVARNNQVIRVAPIVPGLSIALPLQSFNWAGQTNSQGLETYSFNLTSDANGQQALFNDNASTAVIFRLIEYFTTGNIFYNWDATTSQYIVSTTGATIGTTACGYIGIFRVQSA